MELFITLTKGMGEPTCGLLLFRVLAFEACSARPASKVSILFCVRVAVSGL